jgi:hypothetical protein
MLDCKYLREYVKNGKTRFVYAVTGSKEDLATYKKIQGEFHRVDDKTGAVLYNTGKAFFGGKGKLGFKFDGTGVYQDNSQMSQLQSVAEQFGGNLGQELIKASISQMLGSNAPAPVLKEYP